jgi:hypothetical protein
MKQEDGPRRTTFTIDFMSVVAATNVSIHATATAFRSATTPLISAHCVHLPQFWAAPTSPFHRTTGQDYC